MRAIGSVSTSATTQVPVNAATYNEQTTAAARSLKSSSANDTANGSGVRSVRIIYYKIDANGAITGPFAEVVAMNGATAAPTVATDGILYERLEAVDVGSGGVAAGDITLYAANDGTGTAIMVLATGATRSATTHHYVPSDRHCIVTDLEAVGGDAAAALVELVAKTYGASSGPAKAELPISGPFAVTSTLPRNVRFDKESLRVVGPARVRAMVTPANGNAQTTRASFGWVDVR